MGCHQKGVFRGNDCECTVGLGRAHHDAKLPEHADRRLQDLMDQNNEGKLSEQERADLAALAEMSEQLALIRAEALHLLGRKP